MTETANKIAEALDRAKKQLVVSDVYVRDANLKTNAAFDPKNRNYKFAVQFRYRPLDEAQIVDAKVDDETNCRLIRFLFDTGVRIVDASVAGNDVDQDFSNDQVYGEVLVTFVAEYRLKDSDPVDMEAMSAFAQTNAMYHIWPYWRELAQTAFHRMRFPEIVLPMFTVPRTQNTNDISAQQKVDNPGIKQP
jgi:hypothetical protein